MLKHLVPLLLISSNVFAADLSCKVATNPETMTALVRPDQGKDSKEAVSSASLVIGDSYKQDSIRLRVITSTGKTGEAYAFYNEAADGYTVECDGGKINFLNGALSAGGETVLVTDGVRLDMTGCDGDMFVETKGTSFVPGKCPVAIPAPATN